MDSDVSLGRDMVHSYSSSAGVTTGLSTRDAIHFSFSSSDKISR